ncbi:alpha/beta fold hydrolase [Mesorhizobium sp. IMUNJ 23232]|uniref:alpha/beta fold hydrolase n=1 Tax=Mesorhizobium sp. IMUNJ 23232 TaxID=3376064 RepID=UPI003787CF71
MRFDRLRRFDFVRDGLALAAYDSGGDGQPVVFQHGLCGDARQTAEAFPDDAVFRLITLECRGHGASQVGDVFSIATFVEDVAALIDHLGLPPVVIGGISMGAAIASRIAVRRPELVRGLVLARPAWVVEAAPANMRPNLEVGELLVRLSPNEARAAFEASPTHALLAREAPDNLASLLGFFERQPFVATSALLTTISPDGPGIAEADLANLSVPTLVLATGQDFIHPLGHAELLAQLIPGAVLKTLTPKGVDKPAYLADFQAALLAFLKDF